MRKPKAISPSAFMLFEKDATEYAMRYLVDTRPPRLPQPLPASVGSAFDAWVKCQLHSELFGANNNPQFEFDALFTSQVEEHNRDSARLMGLHVFENYVETGAYDELFKMLEKAQNTPRFEFDANLVVGEVPLSGKPDCSFVDEFGNHIILDWKVRGYCSKYSASPTKGYQLCRDGLDWETRNLTAAQLKKKIAGETVSGKHSNTHNKPHKLYKEIDFNGVKINEAFFETCSKDWATQCSMYGWMGGEEVGDEQVIVCIDEIVAKFMGEDKKPLLRVANHKSRVSRDFQLDLHGRLEKLWDGIHKGQIFYDSDEQENKETLEMLSKRAEGMANEEDGWFASLGRYSYG